MGLFFIHIIKSSLCLIAFYIAYKMLLSKETFHRANRFILLSIIVVSLLIPFIQLTISAPAVVVVPVQVQNIEQVLLQRPAQLSVTNAAGADGIYLLLFCIYIIGFLINLSVSIINFMRIYRLANRAVHIPFGKYIIAVTGQDQSAFSWGRYIVLSKNEYDSQPEIIIQHELMHLKRLHSLDLLLTEITHVFFWFNPVVRLLIQELKDTHEFEVDDALISQGVDAKEYQLLLIKKAAGDKIYSIANTFNQSKLSVRIKMMLRQRSNPWAQLKYLCIIVLTLFSVIAFAKPEVTAHIQAISTDKLGGFIKKQVNSITEAAKTAPTPIPQQPVKVAEVAAVKPVQKTEVTPEAERPAPSLRDGAPLCMVNGKPMAYADFKLINPDDIKSVSVLKEKEATEAYGEKAKNGAIVITLVQQKITAANNNSDLQGLLNFMLSAPNKPKCVFFLNDLKFPEEQQIFLNKRLLLMPNINEVTESIVTITGKEALTKYGDEGINGVLEIHLKRNK